MIRAKTNLAFLENVKKETEHILEIVAAFNTDIQAYISALDRPSKTIEWTESLQLLYITDENKQEMQRQLRKIKDINNNLQDHAKSFCREIWYRKEGLFPLSKAQENFNKN